MTNEQRDNMVALIAALRSGSYAQTRNKYFDGKNFCVIGVALELTKEGEWKKGEGNSYFYQVEGKTRTLSFLAEQYGFHYGPGNSDIFNLLRLNDRLEKTFPEIANWLESKL